MYYSDIKNAQTAMRPGLKDREKECNRTSYLTHFGQNGALVLCLFSAVYV